MSHSSLHAAHNRRSKQDNANTQFLRISSPSAPHSDYSLYVQFIQYAKTFSPLQKALDTLDSAFRLYTPQNLAVAFNGGKDATIVMHLARAALANWVVQNHKPATLNCLYMLGEQSDHFTEVNSFVEQQVAAYDLNAVQVQLGIKDGICQFIKRRPTVCAFVLGTRSSDPHGAAMDHFEPSSKTWPAFMRVNPILTWRYHHVWKFMRHFDLPYCCLYDQGYTSLGSVITTQPNPALKEHQHGVGTYKPAWMLEDESAERAGRLPKPC